MSIDDIIYKAGISFPDDIIITEPRDLIIRLNKEAGIAESELSETFTKIFEFAMTSDKFKEIIPPGLSEGSRDTFKILVSTRFANSISNFEPNIVRISNLSKLNRNLVSPCVKILQSIDLINVKTFMRSQIVVPTPLTTPYINVLSGNLKSEYDQLLHVADEVKKDELTSESLKFLEDLETVFHIAKLAYDEVTVNYEIMEDLHNRIRGLVVKAQEYKREELIENLDEFLDIIKHIINVREKARKLGVRQVILEDTKERLGRARVFRVK